MFYHNFINFPDITKYNEFLKTYIKITSGGIFKNIINHKNLKL